MAVKTPDSVARHSVGDLTLTIATFSTNDIDNADTWSSHVSDAVAYWTNATDDPTQEKEKIDALYTQDVPGTPGIGRFTFYTGEANRTGMVYVLAKS